MLGRRLGGFLVVARDERGMTRQILSIIAKHKARLRYLNLFFREDEEATKNSLVFLDVTDCDVPLEGLLIDQRRAIIMRYPLYKGLICGVRERFGSAVEAFLYYNGFEMGVNSAKQHMEMAEKIGLTDPIEIFKGIRTPIVISVGHGLQEIEKLTANPPYALIRIYNSFECECAGKKSDKPFSHLIRGIIASNLTTLFGVNMKVEEVKCIAKGDPYCAFEAKPQK